MEHKDALQKAGIDSVVVWSVSKSYYQEMGMGKTTRYSRRLSLICSTHQSPTQTFTDDPAVMQAWAKDQKVGLSKLSFMGDPASELTKALDMELNHPGPIGKGLLGRCKRHAIYAEKGVMKVVRVSEGPEDPGKWMSLCRQLLAFGDTMYIAKCITLIGRLLV